MLVTTKPGAFKLLTSAVVALMVSLLVLPLLNAIPWVGAVSPNVVISQVYGGGGNSGATYTNDFIELFNRSATSVSLSGWSVQYASSAGNSWSKTDLTGTIAPGQYYLVQEFTGSGGSTPLPTPNATGSINMSATTGKVALVNTTTLLTGACPLGASVVDFVGYGSTTNCSEGSPTSSLSNTTAALRNGNGSIDTDFNSVDFAVGAPNPRNSNSGDSAPSVASTTPANGAGEVVLNSDITITFSEAVTVSGNWFNISCTISGAHTATVSGGPVSFTLNPDSDFVNNETCTVTLVATQVSDQDVNDPPDNLATDYVFSFSTPTPITPIHDIQGASHTSPKNGQNVFNVQGIVTAKASNGFYMQDPNPDNDPATSEGIFVFTSSAPSVNVGDKVSVKGRVSEFRPGGAATNLTTTEITNSSTTVLSSGNSLPAATVIGAGGRVPPTTVIEDDASGNVETSNTFDPANDGLDFYESLEGMLVQINNPVVIGPTNSFNEIWVLADDGGNGAGLRTARGGIVIQPNDSNPERIQIDDNLVGSTNWPKVDVGAKLSTITGVMDYNFGNYEVAPVTTPTVVTASPLVKEVASNQTANQLSIATFNVENLDPGDGSTKFNALAAAIVNNLKSPDIVAIEEVQDNNGPTDNGVVDATTTYNTLISAIQAAGGPSYQFRQIDPVNDQDGGEPGGNIRVGFLFQPDRVSFVDRPGGGSTTATTVESGPNGPQLSASPGRIDPTNPAFNSSRKPLAGEFLFDGQKVFVIANHFNSKGGDDPLFGRFQPPTRSSEVQRHQQAQIVNNFVDSILALDPNARIAVLGDLNDFQFSDTVNILKGGVLNDLIDTLPSNEQYTYDFEGNAQVLDHILTSNGLLAQLANYDVVHINSEFADQISDHDPQVARFTFAFPPTTTATVTPTPNAAKWNNSDVTVTLNATDNPGGVGVQSITYKATGAQAIDETTVNGDSATINITTEGETVITYYATDKNGNAETPQSVTVKLDKTAPVITVTTPAEGAVYLLNQAVTANYGCTDGLSGIASCNGTVANGAALNTTSVGAKTFQVAAKDIADNSASKTVNYTVAYKLCLLYDATQEKKSGSTVPVKLQLCDAAGNNVSSANLVLTAVDVTPVGGGASSPAEDAGNANPGHNFRYDPTLAGYIYNLKTKGLAPGTYTLNFKVGSDPYVYKAQFVIK